MAMASQAGSHASGEAECADDVGSRGPALEHVELHGVALVVNELEGGHEHNYMQLAPQMDEGSYLAAVPLRVDTSDTAVLMAVPTRHLDDSMQPQWLDAACSIWPRWLDSRHV